MSGLGDRRILVTGASGSVGSAVAAALAGDNEVWGLARFSRPGSAEEAAASGIRPVVADLADLDPSVLPAVDLVLHFAVDMFTEPDFERAHRHNVEPAAVLLDHYRDVEAFLHCSSTVVYEADPRPRREDAPLGDYLRHFYPTYSISKIAAEAVVRTVARLHGVPVTIARLNVPYGDTTGMPTMQLEAILAGEPVVVHPEFPDVFAPIHLDDMVRTLPALLGAATVPATIVNWGGDEPVGVVEWSEHMAALLGREAVIVRSEGAIKGMCPDVTVLRELVGGPVCTIGWREGMRRMVEAATATAR